MKSGSSTFPIADSTTQGSSSGKLHTMAATSLIRSAFATDDPPNFMTTLTCILSLFTPISSCKPIKDLVLDPILSGASDAGIGLPICCQGFQCTVLQALAGKCVAALFVIVRAPWLYTHARTRPLSLPVSLHVIVTSWSKCSGRMYVVEMGLPAHRQMGLTFRRRILRTRSKKRPLEDSYGQTY